jgi:hypothetical protein
MNDQLDIILKDLYELDPSLREQEGEVRLLVAALLEARPEAAVPSKAFAAKLRQELLAITPGVVPTGLFVLPLWLRYLAPVGLVAVLIFVLVPSPLSSPTAVTPAVDEAVPVPGFDEGVIESRALEMSDLPQGKRAAPTADTAAPTADTFMKMEMPDYSQAVVGDSFSISPQAPGMVVTVDFVSVEAPSILVIQKKNEEGPGLVYGVGLIPSGYLESLPIALVQPMFIGETFYAILYRDDGDGLFTPGKDLPVYDDSSGIAPLQQSFSVAP